VWLALRAQSFCNVTLDLSRFNAAPLIAFIATVNGGVKSCHWGGAKVGQFGVRALERAALK